MIPVLIALSRMGLKISGSRNRRAADSLLK
jgi:hypothetical protein